MYSLGIPPKNLNVFIVSLVENNSCHHERQTPEKEIRPLTNGKLEFCRENDNLKPEKTSKIKHNIFRIMNSNTAS